jgi:hypothetical protein
MTMPKPHSVRWTRHASERAESAGCVLSDVEDALLEGHGRRLANTGAADWLLLTGPLAIAYNHPDEDDASKARIVTVYLP